MWKIFIVALIACSDPVYTSTDYIFKDELTCIDFLIKAKMQLQPAPGNYLVCRNV